MIRDLLTRNIASKLLALFITFALFLSVTSQERTTATYTFLIESPDVPEDMLLTSSLPDVNVTISGPRALMQSIRDDRNHTIRVEPLQRNQSFVRLTESDLRLPGGVTVEAIAPTVIPIELEERRTRQLPVRAQLRGRPPSGYEIGDVRVIPDRVDVSGPASLVEEMEMVFTQRIDITDLRASIRRTVDLDPTTSRVYYGRLSNYSVHIEVDVEELDLELTDIPVELVGRQVEGIEVRDATMRITLRGPEHEVEQVQSDSIFAAIDLDDLDRSAIGTFTLEPTLQNVPEHLEVITRTPQLIRVRILEDGLLPSASDTEEDDADVDTDEEGHGDDDRNADPDPAE